MQTIVQHHHALIIVVLLTVDVTPFGLDVIRSYLPAIMPALARRLVVDRFIWLGIFMRVACTFSTLLIHSAYPATLGGHAIDP